MGHFALTAFIKFRGPQALRDSYEKPGRLANQTVTDPATFGCLSIDCGGNSHPGCAVMQINGRRLRIPAGYWATKAERLELA